jgi:hypothetical protein
MALRSVESAPWGMSSTNRDSALTVTIRIMLSALVVPPRMTLHYLESALNALKNTDLQMASAFFATRITSVMPALSMSASFAQMVPDLRTRRASLALTPLLTAADALTEKPVINATKVLPISMSTDFVLIVFLDGHQ